MNSDLDVYVYDSELEAHNLKFMVPDHARAHPRDGNWQSVLKLTIRP